MKKLMKQLPIIIGLTFIWLFNNIIYVTYPQWQSKWLLIPIADALVLIVSWLFTKRIIIYWRKRFKENKNVLKRNFFILIQIVTLSLRYTLVMYLGDLIGLWQGLFSISIATANTYKIPLLYTHFTVNLFFFAILIFYEEWTYTKEQQRLYESQIEKLKNENLQTQLDLLKSQINPHFLFNSLNTLSALVADNPQAERFVDELSSIYRYVLQNNHTTLCTLESEIQFIKAYFHLLETRHGEGVKMEINIEPDYLNHQIPPLTLQLLVENAAKHNIVSKTKPLSIKLYNQKDKLIIENNVNKKSAVVVSNKVGLNNIATKYQLLNNENIDVLQDEKTFKVVLPLILPA
jgi:two-component system, LytTR family, sensor kinase